MIVGLEQGEGPLEVKADDDWIAPAFWDLQLNGRWGVSFADPEIRPEQVAEIVKAQAALGTAKLCPTLISAQFSSFEHGLKTIAKVCDDDVEIAARILGVHLEGPYLSSLDGYRGAHPVDAIRDPNWDEFRRFQEAADGRIVLMTLAPERPGSIDFIQKAVNSGVTIALGHTAANGPTLRAAVDAGATLSTHLGNGIASPLARHPNPIWEQAALDSLYASIIADGHHLDPATLRVLLRAKTPARTILVSDASPLAGLPPGNYGLWTVDPSGKIVVAGTPYLAGSNQGLEVGLNTVARTAEFRLAEALAMVSTNPARLLGRPQPSIAADEPANLVIFKNQGDLFPVLRLLRTCVGGQWSAANLKASCPWPSP